MAGPKRSLAHGRACYSSRMRILLSNHEIKSDTSLEDNEGGPDGHLIIDRTINKVPTRTTANQFHIAHCSKHQRFDPTKGYPGEGPDIRLLSINLQGAHTHPDKYHQLINYATHKDNRYDILCIQETHSDPKAYETFRTNHDCVLVKRKEEGTMMDYALPPIPQVETKKWAQTTPIEMLQTQLSSELKKDKDRKEASAEEARQIRQAAATAQADRQARPLPTRRNEDHQAKKRKTFGGYKKWPA